MVAVLATTLVSPHEVTYAIRQRVALFSGAARVTRRESASRGAGRLKVRRLEIEPLESRALLSVNVLGPALPPLSPPVEGASAAVVGQNDDVQPVAQLISYAWSGTGQVKMFYSGRDTWQKDNPWDTNDTTPTATGPKQPAWHLDDPQGDPEDFIANSTPTLTAVFSVSPTDPKAGSQRIKTLQVEAKNLNTEGVALDFNSATVVVPLYVTRITVTLTTNDTVGNQISNSFVLLEWKESINGMTAQPDPVTPTTHQQLFVTYGNPLNPSLNPPTAARVYYATDLAQGITHSNILAVSATIGRDAMSSRAGTSTHRGTTPTHPHGRSWNRTAMAARAPTNRGSWTTL